jgi:hypothetical protein
MIQDKTMAPPKTAYIHGNNVLVQDLLDLTEHRNPVLYIISESSEMIPFNDLMFVYFPYIEFDIMREFWGKPPQDEEMDDDEEMDFEYIGVIVVEKYKGGGRQTKNVNGRLYDFLFADCDSYPDDVFADLKSTLCIRLHEEYCSRLELLGRNKKQSLNISCR